VWAFFEVKRVLDDLLGRPAAGNLTVSDDERRVVPWQKGKDLNEDIGALVKGGLPVLVQQSLDALRVIGNNAVHPGVLDLRDDQPTALSLFHLLNLIVEEQIAKPKTVQAFYASLLQSASHK
jgi:uncharacterized protein DUF4145